MSRRVPADKRPKKQNLQSCPECPARWRDSEVPREQGECSRRPGNASDRPARARIGCRVAEAEFLPARLPRLDAIPRIAKPQRRPFLKDIQNVFIDSYYPKLHAAFSEECENSGESPSSNGDAIGRLLTSERLWLGDSLASDSRAACKRAQIASAEGAARKLLQNGPQLSAHAEIKHSDSKTYTVLSCISDVEPADGKVADRTGDGRGKKEGEAKSFGGSESPFAVHWLAQLCMRIETLEELLQRTLVNSFQLQEESYPKSEGRKIKILVPKTSKPIPDGMSEACEGTSPDEDAGGNEIEDTDNEVRKIKERVRALEMKLQQAKMWGFLNRGKPFAAFNHSSIAKSITVISEVGKDEECPSGSEGESTGRLRVPLRRRSCTTSSTCKSSLRGDRYEGESEEEETDDKRSGKIKKKLVAKCRRIREIYNSLVTSSRETSQTFKVSKGCNEVSYREAIVMKEFLETFHRHKQFTISAQVHPDKKKNATLVYLKCQQEGTAPHRGRRKRKRKDLCRKTAFTNFTLNKSQKWTEISSRKEESEGGFAGGDEWETEKRVQSKEIEEVWARKAAFGWARRCCRGSCTGESRSRSRCPEHARRKNANCECGLKKMKTRMKSCPSGSLMEILKRGGQIKIPVLFKEICKSREPARKGSDISMKFVLVEEDTSHPLRKLIKKLSQRNSRGKEQYVFGVSKCCCGDVAMLAL